MQVEVQAEPGATGYPPFAVSLASSQGQVLRRTGGVSGLGAVLETEVAAGRYLILVEPDPASEGELRYRLRASHRPPTPAPVVERLPPPEPRFEKVSAPVLEVEGKLGRTQAVLFTTDRPQEMHEGLTFQCLGNAHGINHLASLAIRLDKHDARIEIRHAGELAGYLGRRVGVRNFPNVPFRFL